MQCGIDAQLRVFIIDSLLAHVGKELIPSIILKITEELTERMRDIMENKQCS